MRGIRYYILAAGMLLAILTLIQGCQKAATVTPTPDSGKRTASAGKMEAAKPDESKPDAVSTGTDGLVAPKKPAAKPSDSKKPQAKAAGPAATVLPKADIDSHDPKYQEIKDGKTVAPKLEANGEPVTFLYLPPYMFTIELTKNGREKVYLTFGTMTASSETGNRLEVHVLARPVDPEGSKFEKVAVIYSDRTKKGQAWTAKAAGMDLKLQALDYGEWSESTFPDSGMGWLKLKITAR